MSKTSLTRKLKSINLTGQQCGKWTVICFIGLSNYGEAQWKCRCQCGRDTIQTTRYLRSHTNLSRTKCRCIRGGTRGMWGTPEYQAWNGMIQRCYNANQKGYTNYGGRGIVVCPRWRHSFNAFFSNVGPRPGEKFTLGRIDNEGNYQPDNVRWITAKEQTRNRRTTKFVTIKGVTKTLAEWAEIHKIKYITVWHRIVLRGWNPERAFTVPVQVHRKKKTK